MTKKLKIISVFLTAAAVIFSMNSSVAADAGWALRRDKEGIQVCAQKTQGHLTTEYKGVTVVKAPLAGVIALFEDTARMPEWLYQCKEFKELPAENPGEKLFYFRQWLPGSAHLRDVYLSRIRTVDPSTNAVIYTFFHIPGKYPVEINIRRMLYFKAMWRFTPVKNGAVEVEYQFEANPGGHIPAWLFDNVFYEDLSFFSLSRLKELSREPEYQNSFPLV